MFTIECIVVLGYSVAIVSVHKSSPLLLFVSVIVPGKEDSSSESTLDSKCKCCMCVCITLCFSWYANINLGYNKIVAKFPAG